jgi:predicted oxidoreductase
MATKSQPTVLCGNELKSTRREFLAQTAALGVAGAIFNPVRASDTKNAASPTLETAMDTVRIPNTDLTVSRIAYGCNQLIDTNQDPQTPELLARASGLVHTARDQGMTLFDMAAMYSNGKVETLFGEVLKQSPGLRHGVVIQTKCGAVDNHEWKKTGNPAFLFDCSSPGILKSVEGSLSRLGTDRIDILLLHWPDLLLQPEEVAHAFDKLHRDGKVRYFGVSNHTPGQMALLKKHVLQPLVVNQMYLGLADSYPIAAGIEQLEQWGLSLPYGHPSLGAVIDYCRLNDIQVQAYQPVGGIIRYRLLNPPADATPQLKEASQVLLEMAKQKNTTPLALTMAWLLHHPAKIVALTGASKPEHIVENCLANGVQIERDEWFKLFSAVAAVQVKTPA